MGSIQRAKSSHRTNFYCCSVIVSGSTAIKSKNGDTHILLSLDQEAKLSLRRSLFFVTTIADNDEIMSNSVNAVDDNSGTAALGGSSAAVAISETGSTKM